ncbi:MAG: LysR family transcriptional regulator [Planctomycetales bacterium]
MHLRNVEIFCDVAARRSFSKAAEIHGVSQSSASQAVQHLEERLGLLLIDRSQRPLELTPAGRVYYDGCRELLDGFRRVEDRVLGLRDRVRGRVRVASIYSVGLLQMDDYARRFREQYPEVELRLDFLHPDEVYARVSGDECDLGLVSFPRDGGEFACIPWQEQEMGLVVPPAHRLARRRSIPAEKLAGERFVAFTGELTIRRAVDRWLKEARVEVNIVHEFDNVENIKRAVEIGAGVALLPIPTLARELEMGTLAAVPIEGRHWTRPLGIVHRRHKTPSTAAGKFVELLLAPADGAPHNAAGGSAAGGSGNGSAAATQNPGRATRNTGRIASARRAR